MFVFIYSYNCVVTVFSFTTLFSIQMVTKKGKKPELPVISGCLKGLTAYLHSFTQSASESKFKFKIFYESLELHVHVHTECLVGGIIFSSHLL